MQSTLEVEVKKRGSAKEPLERWPNGVPADESYRGAASSPLPERGPGRVAALAQEAARHLGITTSTETKPRRAKRRGAAAAASMPVAIGGMAEHRLSAAYFRHRRYVLQETAAYLLDGSRMSKCLISVDPNHGSVDVMRNSAGEVGFRNLMVCGSVWLCPICSARIAEERRKELKRAIDTARSLGAVVLLASFTVQHNQYQKLGDLTEMFLKAVRKMKCSASYRRLVDARGFKGSVRSLEVTTDLPLSRLGSVESDVSPAYENERPTGWHPHTHELMFFDGSSKIDIEEFRRELTRLFSRACKSFGVYVHPKFGVHLEETWGAVEDYVAKFGHDPAAGEDVWGVESELAKSHVKVGKLGRRLTPFQLLVAYAEGNDAAGEKFREFAEVFKGRRQLVWSNGKNTNLRQWLQLGEEKDDQTIAAELPNDSAVWASLDLSDWAMVVGSGARASVLDYAAADDRVGLVNFLARLRREYWHLIRGRPGGDERDTSALFAMDEVGDDEVPF